MKIRQAESTAAGAGQFGISDAELTPRAHRAISRLSREVQDLREELRCAHGRLEEAVRTADQDHFLPLLNRRAFVRELTRNIAYVNRYGTRASLVYFDLDGLKLINDAHGHAAGDAALTHFAHFLLGHVRESDVIGRLGGDEFGAILSRADQSQAEKKVLVLKEMLSAKPAVWNGTAFWLSFCSGAFELLPGETAASAMARADAAMYRRKREARPLTR